MPSVKRVLLVDDDEMLRASLAEQFATEGSYEVVEAGTCREGLEKGLDGLYEFMILDVSLPDGDGRKLCREFRDHGVTCPVIILTASDSDADTIEGLKAGANRRLAGEDVRKGSVVLPSGRRLAAQDVALAAAVGLTTLKVRRRVRETSGVELEWEIKRIGVM